MTLLISYCFDDDSDNDDDDDDTGDDEDDDQTFSSGNSFFDSENINMTVFEIMMTTVMTHLQR